MSFTYGDAWYGQTPTTGRSDDSCCKMIEAEVRDRLKWHDSFRGHLESLTFELVEGTLILTGRLPSFYLKQMLQTTLKTVSGVKRIDNRVDVVPPRCDRSC